jgi:S1-C subfamily serine protease
VAALIVAVFVSSLLGVGLATRLRSGSVAPPLGSSTTSDNSDTSTAAGSATTSQAQAVAAKVNPGIVDINTVLGYQGGSAAGTGMVLTSSGEVLTNNHVIAGATRIRVTLVTTGRTYTAKVVGTDPADDIAVLQLQGASGLKTIKTGDSSKVTVGTQVVAIGNALGAGGTPSAVGGTIVALNQTITAGDASGGGMEQLSGLIQTDAALQPGDSGGPLVTTNSQVIGMDTAASSSYRFQAANGVSFAIPINTALSVARQIESGTPPKGGTIGTGAFLGVSVDRTQGGGAVVAGVATGTPADAAGIVGGDTITSVDGSPITSATGLTSALAGHKPGDKVTVGWVDATGQQHRAVVTLASGPAN